MTVQQAQVVFPLEDREEIAVISDILTSGVPAAHPYTAIFTGARPVRADIDEAPFALSPPTLVQASTTAEHALHAREGHACA
jgi:hypothetical protein